VHPSLLRTKLHRPLPGSGAIARQSLLDLLHERSANDLLRFLRYLVAAVAARTTGHIS